MRETAGIGPDDGAFPAEDRFPIESIDDRLSSIQRAADYFSSLISS